MGPAAGAARWWLLGLIAALSVVGHDLAMAADARAGAGGADHDRRHAASAAQGHDGGPRGPAAAHAAEPEVGCQVGQTVARPADPPGLGPTSTVACRPASGAATASAGAAAAPPTLPPRVRRALLQVLRV